MQVPLGLIFKSENSSSDMAFILRHIQETYVPHVKLDEDTFQVKLNIYFESVEDVSIPT